MEKWLKIRKRYFLLEVVGIVGIVICFVVGIWSDWNVLVRKNALIIIENIGSKRIPTKAKYISRIKEFDKDIEGDFY